MSDMVERAAQFVWSNARVLERRRLALLLGTGDEEAVVAAVLAYQNPDGGFGHALEPDMRTATSQPQFAEIALRSLEGVQRWPKEMIGPLLDWLEGASIDGAGLPFVLPTVSDAPHAPWWTPPETLEPNLNPTAAIAGLLHSARVDHPWLVRATEWCFEQIESGASLDSHSMLCVLVLLEHAPDRERAQRDFEAARDPVLANVTLDSKAEGYIKTPLDVAPRSHSLARQVFDDDVIEAHLDVLVSRQQEDGGWPIPWDPPAGAARREWRGLLTVNVLATLQSYGRT